MKKPKQQSFYFRQTKLGNIKNSLLLTTLGIAVFVLTSSCGNSTPPKKVSLMLQKAILRVDKKYLVPARQIAITGTVSGETLTGVSLRFAVDRKELLKLRPPHFSLKISNIKMLELNPGLPVYIEARLKSPVLSSIKKSYKKRKKLEDVVTAKDSFGYPALLDLENYTARGWLQEVK